MTKKNPWAPPAIVLPDRSSRINITDLKERIAISNAFTPIERDFLLDCINDVTDPNREESHESHRRSREQG